MVERKMFGLALAGHLLLLMIAHQINSQTSRATIDIIRKLTTKRVEDKL